jgi:glycosyltransferase involved in cell wall biosynthesis
VKILQIVTLVSAVGAFGGPTTVALNQCRALRARGHDTLLIGGTTDLPFTTPTMSNLPVRLFPVRQLGRSKPMAYLISAAMLRWLRRHVHEFDVVHVHLGRDGITLPAALLSRHRGVPYVVQTHGMINPRAGLPQRVVDWLGTRRVLQDADTVFALSADEIGLLNAVLRAQRPIDLLQNGIASPSDPLMRRKVGAPREFLFLARLHPRKRALNFISAATTLLSGGSQAVYTLIGPDDGDGAAVRSAITEFAKSQQMHANSLKWLGPLPPDQTSLRMADAYAYVLPSVDEPFAMSLIEAMAVGQPVVVTESNGLADVVEQYRCGMVVPDDSVESLASAMQQMERAPDMVAEMGRQAVTAARDRFSMDAVADILESRYRASVRTRT